MFRANNISVAGLLLCLLVSYSSAFEKKRDDGVVTLKYQISSNDVVSLVPNGRWAMIKIQTNAIVQDQDVQNNIYALGLQTIGISVQKDDGQIINLFRCPNSAALADAFTHPFAATYNDNGTLSGIVVTGNESTLAINMKLYAASFLQANLAQLRGQGPVIATGQEFTIAGSCPVTNTVTSWGAGQVEYNRMVNLAGCVGCRAERTGVAPTCNYNTCRPATDANLVWTSATDVSAQVINGRPVNVQQILTQNASYNPFKHSWTTLTAVKSSRVDLLAIDRIKQIPSIFENIITEVASTPRYQTVNTNICASRYDEGLKEIYSALVCQQAVSVLYQDIIERAIQCNKLVRS